MISSKDIAIKLKYQYIIDKHKRSDGTTDWPLLVTFEHNLSEEFIDFYFDKLIQDGRLVYYHILTPYLYKKYENKIDWEKLTSINSKLISEFNLEPGEYWIINDGLKKLLNNIKIPTELIIKHIKEIQYDHLMRLIKRLNKTCKEANCEPLYSKEEIKLISTHFMFYGKR